ncbi:olfactory receptor 2B6-like [Lithobates pipiens]
MQQNNTLLQEVILLGFSTDRRVNIALFALFFIIYLITFIGNVLIIFIIVISHQLHTPMYYFLCILSFVDLCNSSSIVPRLLCDLLSVERSISLSACAIQFYIILLMAGTEFILLAIMAYDRYIAICRPLHYAILMRWSVCYRLTAFLWITSFVMFVLPPLVSPVPLCNPNQINHFMCEILAIIKLTCYHVYSSEIMILVICFISILLPFVFILGTYICIVSSVLKIHSGRRSKAFSTCTSHVTVVALFYGSAMILNFGATSPYSTKRGKYISIFYNIVCPMLNPIIYSLNNTEVKEKLKRKNVV